MTTSSSFRYKVNKARWEITLGVYAEGLIYQVNVYENLERQSLSSFIAEATASSEPDRATERQLVNHGVAGTQYLDLTSEVPVADQFFATDSRLYRFRVGGVTADDPRVKRFFGSIMFGKDQNGIVVGDGPGIPFQPDSSEDHPFVGKEVTRKARLAIKPEPAYTEDAKQAAITGTVVLKAIFTSAGNVSDIRVVSGLPYGLTENAIAAAKKIKFYPAVKDGKYVSMWFQLEYNFHLY